MINDENLLKILCRAKELGAVVMAHCENGEQVEWGQERMVELGVTGPEGHRLSRPELVEANATNNTLAFATMVNTPIYIVHVQSMEAAEEVLKFKKN